MIRIAARAGTIIGLALALLIQGCAADKALVKSEFPTTTPITAVHRQTRPFVVLTFGKVVAGATLGVLLSGGLGAGLMVSALSSGDSEEGRQLLGPLDFGHMVKKRFIERAASEIPNWPGDQLKVIEVPIGSEEQIEAPSMLEFKAGWMFNSWRIIADADVELRARPQGDPIWRKMVRYNGSDYGRSHSWDEFRAEDGKLLKEEMEFAIDTIVSAMLKHFRGE